MKKDNKENIAGTGVEGQTDDVEDNTRTDMDTSDPHVAGTRSTAAAVNAMATLLDQQAQQITLLTQLAVAAQRGQPSVAGARAVEVRLRGITPYKGETGDALEAWIAALNIQYDDFVIAQGATEPRFVAAAAGTLADAAVVWWQSVAASARPKTWADMQAALCKQFQSVTNASRARDELMELKQLPKQSVVDYAAAFRRLKTRAGAEFEAPIMQGFLVERFTKGLRSSETRRDLLKTVITKLDDAIEMATRLEGLGTTASSSSEHVSNMEVDMSSAILARLAAMEQTMRVAAAPPGNREQRQQYDSRRDRGANKSSRFTPAWQRIDGMTKELADKRYAAHECLYCGGKEHTMRDCIDRVSKRPPKLN